MKALRGFLRVLRGDFARALAEAGTSSLGGLNSWLPWAYYRMGMYATVAALPLKPGRRRHVMPAVVSLAACGQHDRARQMLAAAQWRGTPARLRVALADALAPFMPVEALQLLESVQEAASPALHAALLLRTNQTQRARELLANAKNSGQAARYPELYLYQTMAEPDRPAQQLERLNRFFAAHGLPPVALCNPHEAPGPCNVKLPDLPAMQDGPLVSVLMTTFQTGARASVAIESLLNQTYRNLEIIVVDDASADDTPELVESWARKDARVRLLRLRTNGGTYLAKSMGLQLARGEFVTCHDSDDWSHPLKIEMQVRPLLDDASLVATTSHWVRMQDDGVFYARPVHTLMRLNPSSPLFRRELVLQRMGAWDCVRTGADSEFHARLRLVFGKDAVKRIVKPLSLGSHRVGSLMTAEDTGYSDAGVSPQRLAYWEAWAGWHLDCLRHGKVPRLPLDLEALSAGRVFAAPEEICVTPEQVRAAQNQVRQLRLLADASSDPVFV
ncbi:glycosyltransferase family A protein [Comamonas testosteroni]|uniref:Glycosyl transferase family 2 n=1 Tax=Comamonas testosteroni (strain DSM 14576 / KF-1) TaxID=399795 RepID=B7X5D6_COMTK|nr:glycosyltransferase family A protein [Comamonas testosteroni]EED66928.1 glycosyl transferase family 2 [Comamonas testosteroni KF-1]WQG65140.1 glycosyltransferase family A protein [Comamonas testosteroni]